MRGHSYTKTVHWGSVLLGGWGWECRNIVEGVGKDSRRRAVVRRRREAMEGVERGERCSRAGWVVHLEGGEGGREE